MTNLGIEILFWTILISYMGLRFSQTWNGFKKQYKLGELKMKLQTQFTVPNKELKDLDYVKKVDFLEETLNKECIDYPNQEDCLVCCN